MDESRQQAEKDGPKPAANLAKNLTANSTHSSADFSRQSLIAPLSHGQATDYKDLHQDSSGRNSQNGPNTDSKTPLRPVPSVKLDDILEDDFFKNGWEKCLELYISILSVYKAVNTMADTLKGFEEQKMIQLKAQMDSLEVNIESHSAVQKNFFVREMTNIMRSEIATCQKRYEYFDNVSNDTSLEYQKEIQSQHSKKFIVMKELKKEKAGYSKQIINLSSKLQMVNLDLAKKANRGNGKQEKLLKTKKKIESELEDHLAGVATLDQRNKSAFSNYYVSFINDCNIHLSKILKVTQGYYVFKSKQVMDKPFLEIVGNAFKNARGFSTAYFSDDWARRFGPKSMQGVEVANNPPPSNFEKEIYADMSSSDDGDERIQDKEFLVNHPSMRMSVSSSKPKKRQNFGSTKK